MSRGSNAQQDQEQLLSLARGEVKYVQVLSA